MPIDDMVGINFTAANKALLARAEASGYGGGAHRESVRSVVERSALRQRRKPRTELFDATFCRCGRLSVNEMSKAQARAIT
jgi:hypothetical protein